MIVVTDVEIIDTKSIEQRWKYWHKTLYKKLPAPVHTEYLEDEYMFCETIEGHRFVWFLNGEKHELCIGWSDQVQKALGLPFDVFKNQEEMLMWQRALIHYYEGMSFWQRLKFLFKGKR